MYEIIETINGLGNKRFTVKINGEWLLNSMGWVREFLTAEGAHKFIQAARS